MTKVLYKEQKVSKLYEKQNFNKEKERMQQAIRPIIIIAGKDIPSDLLQAGICAVQNVLTIARVTLPIHTLSDKFNAEHVEQTDWKTWGNPNWYINSAAPAGQDLKIASVSAEMMFNLYEISILRKICDPYFMCFTSLALAANGNVNLLGWYRESVGSIISTTRLSSKAAGVTDCFETIVMHNIGHVFGLIPITRHHAAEENYGKHCTNICVMRQGFLEMKLWNQFTKDRLTSGNPFCKQCVENLNEYFAS
jgi:hypothetical protein